MVALRAPDAVQKLFVFVYNQAVLCLWHKKHLRGKHRLDNLVPTVGLMMSGRCLLFCKCLLGVAANWCSMLICVTSMGQTEAGCQQGN